MILKMDGVEAYHIGGCECWFYVEGGSVEDIHVAIIRSVYCSWLIRWWR